MQYTVLFFAVKGEELSGRMTESIGEVLDQTRRCVEKSCTEPDAIGPIMEAAEAICRGNMPDESSQPYFDAFLAILNVLGERIELGSFEFNTCLYLEDVGVWPWTQQENPPFPLPRSKEPLPHFGYMSRDFMHRVVLPGIDQLPPCEMGGHTARNEFAEIVESVVDDGLDLIAYYSVW